MFRIGQGWDFHRFDDNGSELILGGVTIPYERGVLAHSDGDVLLHALMDAILGALALEDIGCLFPDTDPAHKGASSVVLTKRVLKMMEESQYVISNIDITLILEAPKVKPFRTQILKSLSGILNIPLSSIGLKATTTEKMGDIGKKEGLACAVTVLLLKAGR